MAYKALWATRRAQAACVAAACFAGLPFLYTAATGGFVADDFFFSSLSNREFLNALYRDWGHEVGPGLLGFRPIAMASYWLDRLAWGAWPVGYHVTNLLLYVMCCWMVYDVVETISRRRRAALLATLAFAVHPTHAEVAAWISGRTGLLAAIFMCSTIAAMVRYLEHGQTRSLLTLSCAHALALLSYEASLTLPVLLGVAVLSRPAPWRRSVACVTTSVLLCVMYLVYRGLVVGQTGVEITAGHSLRAGQYKLLAARLFALPLLPDGFQWSAPAFWATVALVALLLVATRRARKETTEGAAPMLAIAAVWSTVAFIPFLPLDGFTDRFAFLPTIGFATAAGVALDTGLSVAAPRAWRVALLTLSLATAVTWATQLRSRADDWSRAGALAEVVLSESVRLWPNPPPAAVIHAFGIPNSYRSAAVFPTYFERALRQRYGRTDLLIVQHKGPRTGLCREFSELPPESITVFWQADQTTMSADSTACAGD